MAPIIALDFPTLTQAGAFLHLLPADEPLTVKVGMELFYAEGPTAITVLRKVRPVSLFLDLKLHDIPHTVQQAAAQIGRMGVQFTTIHASGGSAMMKAAKQGLMQGAAAADVKPPKLLAITQLTSTSQAMLNQELQIPGPVADSVQHLATLAQTAGCDGVVASAQEAQLIRQVVLPTFLIVTPGIRPKSAAKDDQVRVVTPQQARHLGSSAIVVGRPITQAADPAAAYAKIKEEWETRS